jgi:hypothetical protein
MFARRRRPYFLLALLVLVLAGIPVKSEPPAPPAGQVAELAAGRNVNMVSGTKLPLGDPWLQRQNEPSVAVSSRNPMHLFAAANDYRTIDMSDAYNLRGIPGLSAVRDSWVGVFESFDHGESWVTTLLPGFPQDLSVEGTASPIHGFDTACDPIVRAGANGLFYFSGIAFNRSQQAGAVFVARYADFNNREKVEEIVDEATSQRRLVGPIEYLDTRLVDGGNPGQFIDMPNMAVDVPRGSATFGNVYLAYTVFLGNTNLQVRSRIVLVRSTDGGATWSGPVKLTESQHIIQRPVIAVDPSDPTGNTIYVVFRRFAFGNAAGGIVYVKSTDGGLSFTKPVDVATLLYPFDQYTDVKSFRTNSYPTMAIDGNGTAYVAWAQRGSPDGQARIVISYMPKNTLVWSTPQIVDPSSPVDGHQFMPAMTFGGGKLTVAWYDQRDDLEMTTPNPKFIEDSYPRRHTVDVRASESVPGPTLAFLPSIPVSRYLYYIELDANGEPVTEGGEVVVHQGEANFINLNLFELGTKPFHGDYIEISSSPQILPPPASVSQRWAFNTGAAEPTTSQVVWTDNRNVFPPGGNLWGDWTSYNPPASDQDPVFVQENPCSQAGSAGMRNQNVYTSHLDHGIVVGSPGNTKPLDIQRSFVVMVKNTTEFQKSLTLDLVSASGVSASFDQSSSATSMAAVVPPYSSISTTVYAEPSGVNAGYGSVEVDVREASVLVGRVFLNPDSTNTPILDPGGGELGNEYHNPGMTNPKVWKYDVGNQKEPNASFLSPRAQNPRAQNSGYVNPRAQNSDYLNPRAQNPRAQNANVKNENVVNNEMENPRAQNPRAQNAALTDVVWTVTNEGNTTSAYDFAIVSDSQEFISLFNSSDPPLIAQVLVYKVHTAPIDNACNLTQTHADELLVNVSNPRAQNPRAQNTAPMSSRVMATAVDSGPDLDEHDITFSLAPGEQAEVVLRVYDPNISDPYVFDTFIDNVAGETAAEAINTGDSAPVIVTQPDVPWVEPLPSIVASPVSLSFAGSGSQPISLSLTGGWTLPYDVSATVSTEVDWLTVTPEGGTLSASPLAHTVTVDASGLAAGAYAGWITVAVPEALNNPVRIPVYLNTTGNLVPYMSVWAGDSSVPDGSTYDFGSVPPGTSTDVAFTIENSDSGSAPLILAGRPVISVSGANADQFSVRQQPASPIPVGGSSNFIIRFQPTFLGSFEAHISIANNSVEMNPYEITLRGGAESTLSAYYPFSGNADDESGAGNHGTLQGGAAFTGDRFGNVDRALLLNGTEAYVQAPDSPGLDPNYPLTILAWVYLNDNSKGGIVEHWGYGGEGGDAFSLYVKGAKLATYVPRPGGQAHLEIFSNAALPTGQWTQVGLVSTGTSVSLYINGDLDKTEPVTVDLVDSTQELRIGLEETKYGFQNYLNGRLDDIRIYKSALSSAEIQALFSLENGRVAYYPFNGNADDESGHQLNGTVEGPVLTASAAGVEDRAYRFNGDNDAIMVSSGTAILDLTSEVSVAAWIYPTATKTQDIVLRSSHVNNPPNPYGLGLSQTGDVIFEMSINGVRNEARAPGYDLEKWSFVVGTYNGRVMRLYVNGALVTTHFVSGTIDTVPGDPMLIGTRLRLPADTFEGVLDEISIYNRVLSATEVLTLYNLIK